MSLLRQSLTRTLNPAIRIAMQAPRTLSTSAIRSAEGDTGATKSGGSAQGYMDSLTAYL